MALAPLTVGRGCNQPRFVLPLPDRVGHAAPWGDVLVTLTKSVNGTTWEQSETARTLGLSRIGDQALIRSSDDTLLRAAYSIKHLVVITFFPGNESPSPTRDFRPGLRRIPGTAWFLPRDEFPTIREARSREVRRAIHRGQPPHSPDRDPSTQSSSEDSLPPGARTLGGGLVRAQKLRPEFGLDGGYYEFAEEEYLHVEADNDGAVVLWSSTLPADDVVQVIEDLLGAPDSQCHGFMVSMSGDGSDEPSPEVVVTAKTRPDDLRMFSVGFDECTVSWRSPQVKMRAGKVPHVEISFTAHDVDSTLLSDLMTRTATPHLEQALAKGASDLIQSLVRPDSKGERKKR